MKENLDKKIQQYEDMLATRLERDPGVNFSIDAQRDMRKLQEQQYALQTFLKDHDALKSKWDESTVKLMTSYFLDETIAFNVQLANAISTQVHLTNPAKLKDYINQVALVIAYEKLKMKAVAFLIDSTPN